MAWIGSKAYVRRRLAQSTAEADARGRVMVRTSCESMAPFMIAFDGEHDTCCIADDVQFLSSTGWVRLTSILTDGLKIGSV